MKTRGVAALELALLLPVLLLLPMAAWDLGRALHQHEVLQQTVRAAARHLASGDAADSDRQAQVRNWVLTGELGGTTPILPGLRGSMVQIDEPAQSPGLRAVMTGEGAISLVTVSVRGYRFEPLLLPSWASFEFPPISLTLVYRFT